MQIFERPLSCSFIASVAALAVMSVPLAPSARSQPQREPPGQSSGEKVVSDRKLDAVAAALPNVSNLQQKYEQRIAAATTSSAKERLSREGSDAIEKAVTKEGLSVDEFNSILELAENDQSVRENLLRRIGPPAK